MKAAWYETQGPADTVLVVGEMADAVPDRGEVLIRVASSGINPGDVKKRSDAFGVGMSFPRVIPHSDGSGIIEAVGEAVTSVQVGDRVWCYGAQSYRAFGTAAELVAVPVENLAPLPDGVPFEQGACLGIPGITGHRAVHVTGPVDDCTVLVQGAAGAVGLAAVGVARYAGARVLATVRRAEQETLVRASGAHEVIVTRGLSDHAVVEHILGCAPKGVDHVVEVAFHANVRIDERVLNQGGSIATYATGEADPAVPFWPLVFKNIQIHFLGSDDFTSAQKRSAASDLSSMLQQGWPGYPISQTFPLQEIAQAHVAVEKGGAGGRVVVSFL